MTIILSSAARLPAFGLLILLHDEVYPFLSAYSIVSPFVQPFPKQDIPSHVLFYGIACLSFCCLIQWSGAEALQILETLK